MEAQIAPATLPIIEERNMTTDDQNWKFLNRVKATKGEGVPEDSIPMNMDDLIAKLIRHEMAKWVQTGDHDNLVLTEAYSDQAMKKLL